MSKNSQHRPMVSVIMPIYNGQDYLRVAIDSVLAQTFSNFELIIVNDGSTDSTRSIVESYTDPRIRLFNQENKGLVPTLNRALSLAQGTYIARHDCDDISDHTRFEKQVEYLDQHSSAVLLGTGYTLLDDNESKIGRFIPFLDDTTIRQDFLLRNPFGHGTIMLRKTATAEAGVYAPLSYTEDYEYWWRLAGAGEVHNLPESLYDWRVLASSMSHTRKEKANWALINRLRKTIWQKSEIAELCKKDFRSRARLYKRQSSPAFYQQFINLQVALCVALEAQGMKELARIHLLRVLLLHPTAIRRYHQIRKSQTIADYDLRFFFEKKITLS